MTPEFFVENFERLADAPGGVTKLKEVIRRLAVEGLLVRNDPSDTSATELITRAKKYVEAATKNLKKGNRKTGGNTAHPIEYPATWESVPVSEILHLINGRAFKPTEWSESGIPIVRIQNLNDPAASYNFCDFEVGEKFLIDDDDLLVSWSGTPGTSFGAFIWSGGKAVLNQHIFKAIFDRRSLLDRYMELAVDNLMFRLIEGAVGGVGLRHVRRGQIENSTIGIPPLAEQVRIVAKVDELMAKCDELEKRQEAIRETRVRVHKASLNSLVEATTPDERSTAWQRLSDNFDSLHDTAESMQRVKSCLLDLGITGKLGKSNARDESADELAMSVAHEATEYQEKWGIRKSRLKKNGDDLPDSAIPASWNWMRLSSLCLSITDGDHQAPPKTPDGIPFLVIGNVSSGSLDFRETRYVGRTYYSELDHARKPQRGDILYTVTGSYGIPVAVETDTEFCVQRHIAIIRPSTQINLRFLHYCLRSNLIKAQADDCATGIAQKTVPLSGIRNFFVPVPPKSDQDWIADRLDRLVGICDDTEALADSSGELLGKVATSTVHALAAA